VCWIADAIDNWQQLTTISWSVTCCRPQLWTVRNCHQSSAYRLWICVIFLSWKISVERWDILIFVLGWRFSKALGPDPLRESQDLVSRPLGHPTHFSWSVSHRYFIISQLVVAYAFCHRIAQIQLALDVTSLLFWSFMLLWLLFLTILLVFRVAYVCQFVGLKSFLFTECCYSSLIDLVANDNNR